MKQTIDSLVVTVLAEDSVGFDTPYLGQHGISLLIDACCRDEGGDAAPKSTRILMDVGQHSDALLHNMALLDIAPSSIDAIVLTHCHYDHTRGVVRMIREIGRPGLPVVAHPDIFRPNFELTPDRKDIGMAPEDGAEAIHAAGAQLALGRTPHSLAPGLVTSGEVARTTSFEGKNAGLFTEQDGQTVPDPMMDDVSIYATVEGCGVVVLTGCSHAGIVNIVRSAREVTGANQVAAVVGGLHLIVADDWTVAQSVSGLQEEGVGQVCAGHCTGFTAQVALQGAFGRQFSPLRTGQVLTWPRVEDGGVSY